MEVHLPFDWKVFLVFFPRASCKSRLDDFSNGSLTYVDLVEMLTSRGDIEAQPYGMPSFGGLAFGRISFPLGRGFHVLFGFGKGFPCR